ncbi:MAG: hypothetical protein UZ12_BCD005001606 [Bacteroidetes bacterium OLB12]|nr:MAG: hypothetical protein UZ12_BCD005001606 [Bacteroidetes bacterium OLB12]
MYKFIALILFSIISKIALAQTAYKQLIEFRFLDKVEAHYVGNLSIVGKSHQPAFDPVDENYNRDSIIQIINHELDKYPIDVLKLSQLVEIVICDGVYFNDQNNEPTIRASGTYIYPVESGHVIFLDGYSKGLPKTLHHEFSSVLFNQLLDLDSVFRIKYLEVQSYFKKMTKYIEDNPNWIDDRKFDFPKNMDNKLVLRNDGYALTAFENDYNSIASSLFAPRNVKSIGEQLVANELNFWEFLKIARTERYPIYNKVNRIINLYSYINPIFGIAYFQKMEASK